MNLSTRILGSTVVKTLTERTAAPVLVIGRDAFTRADLAAVRCYNFTAAANLSALLKALKVRDTRDVFDRVPPDVLVMPRLGSISIAVLGAAFERKKLGGAQPLEAWVMKHRGDDDTGELVTFDTMKTQVAKREHESEREALKKRKDARRDQAHRIRVDRYTKRHTEGAPA